jgi:hypothetical protein
VTEGETRAIQADDHTHNKVRTLTLFKLISFKFQFTDDSYSDETGRLKLLGNLLAACETLIQNGVDMKKLLVNWRKIGKGKLQVSFF